MDKGQELWEILAPRIQFALDRPVSWQEGGLNEFILSHPRWYRSRPEFVEECIVYYDLCDMVCPQDEVCEEDFSELPFHPRNMVPDQIWFLEQIWTAHEEHELLQEWEAKTKTDHATPCWWCEVGECTGFSPQ
jgi:hypothetical protein